MPSFVQQLLKGTFSVCGSCLLTTVSVMNQVYLVLCECLRSTLRSVAENGYCSIKQIFANVVNRCMWPTLWLVMFRYSVPSYVFCIILKSDIVLLMGLHN